MPRPFLTARWIDLALITYAIDPAILRPLLPVGCEPDLVDGTARGSLVAFDFTDTRVRGIAWPMHVNFPEVNLRFYVRRGGIRGVWFLREFVPRLAIATIARWIYNEPYAAVPMRSSKQIDQREIRITHHLKVRGRWQQISVRADLPATVPSHDAAADWIKEHRWGFGQTRRGRSLSYEVVHPAWAIYSNPSIELDYDFEHVYGPTWRFLTDAKPVSIVFAAGSEVSVWPRQIVED